MFQSQKTLTAVRNVQAVDAPPNFRNFYTLEAMFPRISGRGVIFWGAPLEKSILSGYFQIRAPPSLVNTSQISSTIPAGYNRAKVPVQ